MADTEAVFQLLYVSQLAAGQSRACVDDIVATSRAANPARGITGALVFDGEHFCQLIEGTAGDVWALMQRIAHDPRHANVMPLYNDHSRAVARSRVWRSGRCEPRQLRPFAEADGPRDEVALALFMSVLARTDLA